MIRDAERVWAIRSPGRIQRQSVILNKMVRVGFIEKVYLNQDLKKGSE